MRLPTSSMCIGEDRDEIIYPHPHRSPPKKPGPQPRPEVIAIRKTCDAEGTGLSHYVLMDKQVKR